MTGDKATLSDWKLPSKWSGDLQYKKALINPQVLSHLTYLVHMPFIPQKNASYIKLWFFFDYKANHFIEKLFTIEFTWYSPLVPNFVRNTFCYFLVPKWIFFHVESDRSDWGSVCKLQWAWGREESQEMDKRIRNENWSQCQKLNRNWIQLSIWKQARLEGDYSP